MSLQVYDSYSHHLDLGFLDSQNTANIDFQHHLALGSRNDMVWGLGVRVVNSSYGQGYDFRLVPNHRIDPLYSAFLQDQIELSPSLSLTVGTKWEHNDVTGSAFQPSAQLVWTPADKQTVWISAARALREPSSVDVGLYNQLAIVPAGPTFGLLLALGNPNIKAEELRDVEAGYRVMPNKRVSFDVTGFESYYPNLESIAARTPYLVYDRMACPTWFCPISSSILARHAPMERNFSPTGVWWAAGGSVPVTPTFIWTPSAIRRTLIRNRATSPNHQFQVRSLLDLPHHLEWDDMLGYVDKLALGNIPAYARLDSRLGWRVGESLELSVVGQNLLTTAPCRVFRHRLSVEPHAGGT